MIFFHESFSLILIKSAEKVILKKLYSQVKPACFLTLASLPKFLLIHLEQQATILATNILSVSDKQHFYAWHLHFKT